MAIIYICDACGVEIARGAGLLFDYENNSTNHGDMTGFGFFAWNETAARHVDYGHVHRAAQCISKVTEKCMSELGWLRSGKAKGTRA